MNTEITNYYEILDLPTDVSQKMIDSAYQRLLRTYSSDSAALYSLMGTDECQEMREQIEEAYSILGHPHKRMEYDRLRGFNSDAPESIYQKSNLSSYGLSDENNSHLSSTDHLSHDTSLSSPTPTYRKSSSMVDRDWAVKKFELDFTVNPEMEDLIERTNEFTGEFLRQIREYKNVSIDRLAEMSKILKTYLIYIEDDAFDKLPATVYARGFIYQYAKCLKLNFDLVTKSYIERLKRHRGEISRSRQISI